MNEHDDEYIETIYAPPRGLPVIVLRHDLGSKRGSTSTYSCGTVYIGRRRDCDLRFDSHGDRMVSSRHARLFDDGGKWILEDLGSTNGTLVNGREITGRVVLAHGDTVILGCLDTDGSAGFRVSFEQLGAEISQTVVPPTARDQAVPAAGASPPSTQTPATAPTPSLSFTGGTNGELFEFDDDEPVESEKPPAPIAEPAKAAPRGAGGAARTAPARERPDVANAARAIAELERTLPDLRAAAADVARQLALAMWTRGGIDWSACSTLPDTLDAERAALDAEQTLKQHAADETRETPRSTTRLEAARRKLAVTTERCAQLKTEKAACEAETRSAADALAPICDPLFETLDEVSLVFAEIVARHRPAVDDSVIDDLAELRTRLTHLENETGPRSAALAEAIGRRKEAAARAMAVANDEVTAERALHVARRDLATVESHEAERRAERTRLRQLAEADAVGRRNQLDAAFASLGIEVVRLGLREAIDFPECAAAAEAVARLDAAERQLAGERRHVDDANEASGA